MLINNRLFIPDLIISQVSALALNSVSEFRGMSARWLPLITTGADGLFQLRIVIFTTLPGVIAGYYQEKYNNHALAIIVQIAGNLPGVIGTIILSLNT